MVPATTEIVIEGRFLPNERRPEGPFGEFMGYYTPVGPNAVFEVLGVTRRKDAIFHSILCGGPEEVLTLELSVAANIYQRVSAVLPGIIDAGMTENMSPERRDQVEQVVPMGRLGQGNEVGELIAFLASDRASYITGQTIAVNGGLYM